jgi:hypothetical protein
LTCITNALTNHIALSIRLKVSQETQLYLMTGAESGVFRLSCPSKFIPPEIRFEIPR